MEIIIKGKLKQKVQKAQVILVWVRAPGVGNAFHQRGLVMKVNP